MPAEPPHDVGWDRSDAHTVYDVFRLYDMADMAKVLRNIIKRGALGHVFASLYNFRSGTRLQRWNRRIRETVPRTIPARAGPSVRGERVCSCSRRLRERTLHCTIFV